MRVFRHSYPDPKTGETRTTPKLYLEFKDHHGLLRRMPGFADKAATRELGQRVDRLIACRVSRQPLDPELSRWVEDLPAPMRQRLAKISLLDSRRLAASRDLSEHLLDYEQALLARGRTTIHAQRSTQCARRVFEGCGFRVFADIEASPVERFLRGLREEPEGIGAEQSNHYLQAARQFCNWMIETGRASENPLLRLRRINAAIDRRHERRALSLEEARRLLDEAAQAPTRFGLTGPQRALLYRLALETGLRANEIRTLRCDSFDLGASPTVTVEAGYSKRRERDVLPLRSGLAEELRSFLASHLPMTPVFPVSRHWRTSEILQADLAGARIPFADDGGRLVDFHALRHTFITNLARSGVHPKTAQALARHSTITLTMDRYSHVFREDEVKALEGLPDLERTNGALARSSPNKCPAPA